MQNHLKQKWKGNDFSQLNLITLSNVRFVFRLKITKHESRLSSGADLMANILKQSKNSHIIKVLMSIGRKTLGRTSILV